MEESIFGYLFLVPTIGVFLIFSLIPTIYVFVLSFFKATPFVEEAKGRTVAAPVTKNYNEWLQIWTKYTSLMVSDEMDPKSTLDKIKAEGDPVETQ